MTSIQEPRQVLRSRSSWAGLRGVLSYREEWLTDKQGLADPVYLVTSAFSSVTLPFWLAFSFRKEPQHIQIYSSWLIYSQCQQVSPQWLSFELTWVTDCSHHWFSTSPACWRAVEFSVGKNCCRKQKYTCYPRCYQRYSSHILGPCSWVHALALSSRKTERFTFSFFLYVFWLFNCDCFEWVDGGIPEICHT